MEYVYAAMLLHSAKKDVNEQNVKKVLEAAGVRADEGRIKALVAALEGVDIEQAIKEAAVTAVAAPVATVGSSQAAQKAPKEEKKSEEAAAAGLAGLFG